MAESKFPHGQLRWCWGMAKLAYCDCARL